MEGNPHLLQLIRKMRSQIHKLERENRALKGELRGCGHTALPARREGSGRGAEGPAASPASPSSSPSSPPSSSPPSSLQGGAAAAPAPRERTDAAMTVRRYPAASPAPCSTRSRWAGRKPPSAPGLLEAPGGAQPPAPPAAAQPRREQEEGLGGSPASRVSCSPSRSVRLLQERVYKCQGKVKAVSFLLPTDMSSFTEKQGSLKSPQNQSMKHLMTITEKDM